MNEINIINFFSLCYWLAVLFLFEFPLQPFKYLQDLWNLILQNIYVCTCLIKENKNKKKCWKWLSKW